MEILITLADPSELTGGYLPFDFACYLAELNQPILVTGMGAASAQALDDHLRKHNPQMIVNIGTCVSKKPEMTGTVHYFNKFRSGKTTIEVPTSNLYVEKSAILTSPTFITSAEQMGESSYGDMESFHQARVCMNLNKDFLSIKVVSDCAATTSIETWKKALPAASSQIRNVIKFVCQTAREVK